MMKIEYAKWSIRRQIIVVFVFCFLVFFGINIFVYGTMKYANGKIEALYGSNVSLNDLQDGLDGVQNTMKEYLDQKTSESMEAYYRAQTDYLELIDKLNQVATNQENRLMEKNIHNLSQSYLDKTDEAVEAKRGRNVECYKNAYEEATRLNNYIETYIYSLNNEQFRNNSMQYKNLTALLQRSEVINLCVLAIVVIIASLFINYSIRGILAPLSTLGSAANMVAAGNFDVQLPKSQSQDEVGSVIRAFNKMVESVRHYIDELRKSMEIQSRMREQELEMENNLKDAQLKYLQAQISPHFLFNTLNAGAQLAMIEGAEKSYNYIQNVAEFFRYSLKSGEDSTLGQELELVDHYIYILNVRFAGEIHYTTQIDPTLVDLHMPSMILQPIVENSVNYGIRDVDWEKHIELEVTDMDDMVCVCIRDNGVGIEAEKIQMIMEGRQVAATRKDSNGVGMANVKKRLMLYYGVEDVLVIHCLGENVGTEVLLYLPYERNVEND